MYGKSVLTVAQSDFQSAKEWRKYNNNKWYRIHDIVLNTLSYMYVTLPLDGRSLLCVCKTDKKWLKYSEKTNKNTRKQRIRKFIGSK